jgi:hypothetical protein
MTNDFRQPYVAIHRGKMILIMWTRDTFVNINQLGYGCLSGIQLIQENLFFSRITGTLKTLNFHVAFIYFHSSVGCWASLCSVFGTQAVISTENKMELLLRCYALPIRLVLNSEQTT